MEALDLILLVFGFLCSLTFCLHCIASCMIDHILSFMIIVVRVRLCSILYVLYVHDGAFGLGFF
jgi:hypothetical protein